ncbi:hypothetical protein D3C77_447740 [compost metagenome]
MPAEPHRLPPEQPLCRRASQGPGRRPGPYRQVHRRRQGHLHRPAGQRRRNPAGTGQAWRASRHGHRPDQRPRPTERLPASRLDLGTVPRPRPDRPGCRGQGCQAIDGRTRPGHARLPEAGHPDLRLRQQHPPDGQGRRRQQCVRFPGLRTGLHPSAVLPRYRSVPLGGTVGQR